MPGDAPKPKLTPRPTFPEAAELRTGLDLSAGAVRVHRALVELAGHVHETRQTARLPDALTFHCPAVVVAALVGYSERHFYRLAAELRAAGLIDARGHVGQVGHLRRYTGTLWAVSLKAGHRARLRFWDFQAPWRADFEADYYSESGAWREVQAVMSEPLSSEWKTGRLLALAKTWAAASRTAEKPARDGSDMRVGATFPGLAAALPGLLDLHPAARHRAVSAWGASLAALLGEPHRLKQWCGAVYRALAAENEMRPGLAHLAAALYRFGAELRAGEGEGMKRPGAILAARL